MKIKILIGLLIIIVVISGCAKKECETADDCTSKTCVSSDCKNNKCVYSFISDCCGNEICEVDESYPECAADCPNCDDTNECTTDSYDYHKQECVNAAILDVVCCGNSVCELSETYESCTRDCPNCDDTNFCTTDSYDYHKQECVNAAILDVVCCGNSVCELSETYESCRRDCPNCDDTDFCTTDSYDYRQQECVNEDIIPCCGNDTCDEDAETFSNCSRDCPDCDDNNKMTGDSFDYTTQKCEYVTYYFFEDFKEDDIWTTKPNSYNPSWAVVDGMLTTVSGVDRATTSFGDRQWTDYTLRLKIKLEQGTANVYVRAGHGEGADGYGVTISENSLALWKDINDGQNLESVRVDLGLNQFHDIAMAAKGSNLKVYFNGNLEIDYTDTDNPVLDGHGRLGVQNPGVYFDDLIVEEFQYKAKADGVNLITY